MPETACATMRAIGVLPRRAAVSSLVTTTAAAPSLVPGALPAVTVPSFLNAGRSLASASSEASARGDSSRRMTMGSPFFCGTSIGKNLRFDEAGVHGVHGSLMAFEGELILLLARDFVFLGDEFGGHAHVEVFVNVPKAVVNHGIDDLAIADAVAGARAGQQIRAVGHGLHAAGDDDFAFAEHHALRGQRDGFESRAADFVDGHGGDARVQAAAQRRLPRRILAQARLHDVAHDDFVDRVRLDAGAARGFGDDSRAKLGGRKGRERALKFADRRAHGAQDHGLAEGLLLHNGTPCGLVLAWWAHAFSITRPRMRSILARAE